MKKGVTNKVYNSMLFYDDETRSCYVYRAKLFKQFLEKNEIPFKLDFYSFNNYIVIDVMSGLSRKKRNLVNKYINKYGEDGENDEGDDGESPDIKQYLFELYLNDIIE